MLATGGSAVAAIDFIKQHGGKHIKFMCVIAAPEGLERLRKAHPDVQIYVGHLDRQLNEKAYICPGSGRRRRQDLRNQIKQTAKELLQKKVFRAFLLQQLLFMTDIQRQAAFAPPIRS